MQGQLTVNVPYEQPSESLQREAMRLRLLKRRGYEPDAVKAKLEQILSQEEIAVKAKLEHTVKSRGYFFHPVDNVIREAIDTVLDRKPYFFDFEKYFYEQDQEEGGGIKD